MALILFFKYYYSKILRVFLEIRWRDLDTRDDLEISKSYFEILCGENHLKVLCVISISRDNDQNTGMWISYPKISQIYVKIWILYLEISRYILKSNAKCPYSASAFKTCYTV